MTIIPFVSQSSPSDQSAWLAGLATALPDERIVPFGHLTQAERQAATVALVANPHPGEIERLPNLVYVQSLWAGVERLVLDLKAFTGTIVRLVDPELARTMAEAVLAWTLYLHRDMPAYAAAQRTRLWQPLDYMRPQDRRVSLLGLGELGRAAALALTGAGFDVRGWSRTARTLAGISTFSGQVGLQAMLAQTDIAVCLLPLTRETRGLLGQTALGTLPAGTSLINFGRGPVIDEGALLSALDAGRLSHAVLDVFETEPLPDINPLWVHPRVTILPHISAATNVETASAIAAANIKAFRADGTIPAGIDRRLGY